MKQTIGFSQFCDAFSDTYKNNFTYEGKRALFDYLEQMEEGTGEEIELDIVAFCCEYSEYENLKDAQEQAYPDIESMEELQENTTVIPIDDDAMKGTGRFIIQDF